MIGYVILLYVLSMHVKRSAINLSAEPKATNTLDFETIIKITWLVSAVWMGQLWVKKGVSYIPYEAPKLANYNWRKFGLFDRKLD